MKNYNILYQIEKNYIIFVEEAHFYQSKSLSYEFFIWNFRKGC